MWICSNRWARIVGIAAVVAGCGGGGMVVPCKAQVPELRGGSMLNCSGFTLHGGNCGRRHAFEAADRHR